MLWVVVDCTRFLWVVARMLFAGWVACELFVVVVVVFVVAVVVVVVVIVLLLSLSGVVGVASVIFKAAVAVAGLPLSQSQFGYIGRYERFCTKIIVFFVVHPVCSCC